MAVFLIVAVLAWVARGGFDHARADYRRSREAEVKKAAKGQPGGKLPAPREAAVRRRHGIGYWTREVTHGLPVVRTGLHTGWTAHKIARRRAEEANSEARTAHAETEASVLKRIREHHHRQMQAYADLEQVHAEGTPEQPSVGASPREKAQAAANIADYRRRKAAQEAEGSQKAVPPLPSETVDRKAAPGPYGHSLPTCSVCGQPLRAHPHDGKDHLACAPAQKRPAPGPYAPRGVVHHDHSLVLPGECPDCGGPGPGIPLVRGDRVAEVREQDGTLVARDAVVLGNDGKRVLLRTPDGRQIDAPSALPLPPTRRLDGKPETEADRKFLALRESGYEGPIDQDGDAADDPNCGIREEDIGPDGPDIPGASRNPQPIPPSPPTGGDTVPVAADTTYDQEIATANRVIGRCEQRMAELRIEKLGDAVEQIVAMSVDPASISNLSGAHEGIQQEMKAVQSTLDSMAAYKANLISTHQAGAEYHQGTVNGGAEKPFFAG